MSIGEKIRAARKNKGMTQKQLGAKCGMADSAIRKYESGTQTPKLETLQRIADALKVPVSYFYGDNQTTERIRSARNDANNGLGYSAEEFAKICGIPVDIYASMESGMIKPTDQYLNKIAKAIGLGLNEFLGDNAIHAWVDEFGRFVTVNDNVERVEEFHDALAAKMEENSKRDIAESIRKKLHHDIDELNNEGVRKAADFVGVLYSSPQYIRKDTQPQSDEE